MNWCPWKKKTVKPPKRGTKTLSLEAQLETALEINEDLNLQIMGQQKQVSDLRVEKMAAEMEVQRLTEILHDRDQALARADERQCLMEEAHTHARKLYDLLARGVNS